MNFRYLMSLLALVPALAVACGDDDDDDEPKECKVGDDSTCKDGLECQAVAGGKNECFCSVDKNVGCADAGTDYVCENVPGGNSGCFPPLYVKGKVFDLETKGPIEGARVVARDPNNAAQSGIAVTDALGEYNLRVPAPRDKDGKPVTNDQSAVTMRADAKDYLTFPKPPRVALAVELSKAVGDPLTIQSSATEIGLLPLKDTANLGTIRGKILTDRARGALVVAGGAKNAGGGVTGVADTDGTYAVFNVPAGSTQVKAYKAGLQIESATGDVTGGGVTENVDLALIGDATAVVTGKIELVNPGAGSQFSVVLAVDETFDETYGYGESPPGLRVFPVVGDFSMPDVPDGNYVVLASFETDFLVRDPDYAIGGTDSVHIVVAGSTSLPEGFKVTGALDVVSPDKEAVVSGTPAFVWADDSGEDHYEVRVFDAYGTKIWERLDVPGVSGDKTVTINYGDGGTTAEPLVSGMIYQFRATAIKQGGSPISRTEDLRGTFLYQ